MPQAMNVREAPAVSPHAIGVRTPGLVARAATTINNPLSRVLLVGAGLAYIYTVDPNRPGGYPVCATYAISGLYCPGCGLLRSTHALLHGDVITAISQNAVVFTGTLTALTLSILWLVARVRGRSFVIPRWLFSPSVAIVAGVSVGAFTILRNIPGFEALAPY